MSTLSASIAGIGFWAPGLPTWDAAVAFARDGVRPETAPARPQPQVLAPNERRRAPDTVAVALDVAQAACTMAGIAPGTVPSVFASMHGDLAITDYMCATLADTPASISPTKFHNSVHNAAAGYWTIGTGCMAPATSISAFDATFAQGLLEALVQLASGAPAVLLVGYDCASTGPLAQVSRSTGVLGGALLLVADALPGAARLQVQLADGDATPADGPLATLAPGNAMAPMLPLFDALARGDAGVALAAGAGRVLQIHLTSSAAPMRGAAPHAEPAHA